MTKNSLDVVVAGGGTAGHIEPALAVAAELRKRGANVIALGTAKGLEKDIVPARGFELQLISPVPVPRKINLDLFKLPLRLIKTIGEARRILRNHNADILIGFGGYVSAPGYLAARSLGIPFIIHEANARAGLANKLGEKLGGLGLNAVAGSGMPGKVVGIPIRTGLHSEADKAAARERGFQLWGLDPSRRTLVVTGGSQGAQSLNVAVEKNADALIASGWQILHVYGPKNTAPTPREHLHAVAYVDDMAAAYQVADVIVCRSGAMTVAEVTHAAVPAVYVPLPHGNGEQGLNASAVIKAGAAVLVDDRNIADQLVATVDTLIADDQQLGRMREAARNSGVGNAAETIADIVFDITDTHRAETDTHS
ncbi:undecaprenyldiphospho-muramoylpentapeptide beta-N-acetylglucosaminyltransferase [Corynebacterium felinum]|uniref:UDP-N-acetylglucosamine--N-acetylmuramyl-(pentapeptide) pyrophosphoryl-undecaprenol N-acetylglucosamine transferase n=1 Tax=Corynebacterium felinum TaxID=131318 RepID=A0ABU2BCQ5_9CORY|nr:undecaprenyldiphospho-muramoylpentapeptide beta-N-acetylglucosaminyltransferase [Corynebacterium felinum]MDF5820922.1 undecaprenyldiphospho-muramoylpentapeptide beta-N-acetylglucosaminyltransferase [Corynebacterium felinum]MDR7356136.1 UDP-N-acetylglucosamine--N-acetylmuramyl-(pentapeptide) pyrophosphoryl-undecaprenol N-acetylglucosamine transferase [Corynebacterium felinum]WJY95470.1 UDP-N-acetylglucosamine--N-acetylmuramyl-(pentapeptide) pyrophosphoryl-undecaprenol N-acetylglucosamine trans